MTPGTIISIVGLVISVFSFFGLGLWFQRAWNKRFREIDKKEADAKELHYRRNEKSSPRLSTKNSHQSKTTYTNLANN